MSQSSLAKSIETRGNYDQCSAPQQQSPIYNTRTRKILIKDRAKCLVTLPVIHNQERKRLINLITTAYFFLEYGKWIQYPERNFRQTKQKQREHGKSLD